MAPSFIAIQHRGLRGQNTTTLATYLLNNMYNHRGHQAQLTVAKAFPSVPQMMITKTMPVTGAFDPTTHIISELCNCTPLVLCLHWPQPPT